MSKQRKLFDLLFNMMEEEEQAKLVQYAVKLAGSGLKDFNLMLTYNSPVDDTKVVKLPPKSKPKQKDGFTVHGQHFKSVKKACEHFGVKYQTACQRRSRGLPLEEVFKRTKPKDTVLMKRAEA